MKFRVIDEKGAYLARSSEVVRLELGADAAASKVYSVRAPVYELLIEGTEVEGPHILFGPHLEPLDEEAREAARQYWRAHPDASLDPTSMLPVTGGFGDLVQHQLERLLREAEAPRPDELALLRAQNATMAEQLAALIQQVAALTAARPPGRKAVA